MIAKFSGWIVLAFVAGLWAGTAVVRSGEPARAQTVDDKTTRWLAASVGVGNQVDCLALFDSQTQRLLMYRMDGDTLRLLAVREITYDLKPVDYPDRRQFPPVSEMKKVYEKYLQEQTPEKPEKK